MVHGQQIKPGGHCESEMHSILDLSFPMPSKSKVELLMVSLVDIYQMTTTAITIKAIITNIIVFIGMS